MGTTVVVLLSLLVLGPAAAGRTPDGYAKAVASICDGALLFDGKHQIGTRAAAVAVSKDIRVTGTRRLDRVAAVPRPASIADAATRWLGVERRLVEMYATTYLQIWDVIEQAVAPRERSRLPAELHALIHRPDALERRAAGLELQLGLPDCTGGQSRRASSLMPD